MYAVRWPGGAKVALNLVLNYEEGGENCLLHGDGESEKLLSEIVGAGAIGKLRMYIMHWFLNEALRDILYSDIIYTQYDVCACHEIHDM